MNIYRYTRTIPYLVVNDYAKDTSIRVELNDKIILRTKEGRSISGYVHKIGTKYLTIRTSGITYIAQSIMNGKCCSWSTEEVSIAEIDKIAKYPEESQQYPNEHLGRKSTNNHYFRQSR